MRTRKTDDGFLIQTPSSAILGHVYEVEHLLTNPPQLKLAYGDA